MVYSKTGLANGTHTIRIVNKTTSVGMVDALRILTGGTPPAGGRGPEGAGEQPVRAPSTAGTGPLIADAAAIGGSEQFDIVDLGGGNVALRARVNDQFVCAENAGANPLDRQPGGGRVVGDVPRWSATPTVASACGTVNNRYVTAENAGAAALIANRTAIGPWEKFDLVAH